MSLGAGPLGSVPLGGGFGMGGFGVGPFGGIEQVVQEATQAAPAMAARMVVETVTFADAVHRCLRATLDAIENGVSPDSLLFAWSFVLALAWVIYARHQGQLR